MISRAHVTVRGDIQGVSFRAATMGMAKGLGLAGWVRNLPDGGVEAVFEGEKEKVMEAIDFCMEGPPGAKVGAIELEWERSCGEAGPFSIRPDA